MERTTMARRMALALAVALIAAAFAPAALAERFTPSITPTHLPLFGKLSSNAMLLTRTSMPPGLTATHPAYVAPTAEQLADEHAAWVWIGPSPDAISTVPLAFIASRVCEIAAANMFSAQYAFVALRMFNGSVQVYQSAASIVNGVEQYAAPYWLPGVYSEITAGEAHMCFLRTDQHVECKTTTAGFLAPAALMESRSTVTYTQITAASRFTCGLRAVDQLVECFGAVGRDVNALLSINYTSSMRYASISAQFDSGFCGILVATGDVACYSIHATGTPETVVLAAPTAPATFLYPLWMFLDGASDRPWNQSCAMLSDGRIDCVVPLPVDPSSSRPMSQATSVNAVVMGATTDNGQLQQIPFSGQIILNPTANLFDALRFIGVDPVHGNDTTCATVRTQYPSEFSSFIPCATLTHAVTLIAHPNTWIQLLPGSHTAASVTLNDSDITIAAAPPSFFTPGELALLGNGSWLARMEETAGQAVTIDCAGALHCFSTMHSDIRFLGLTLTGSMEHAIVSSSDNSTDASSRLPPSTLAITNCVFDAMGAVLLKTKGSVAISGCTITNSLQSADTIVGLIELEDASLTMTGTTFSHNAFPDSDLFLRSCLRSESSLPVTVSISDSHWLDNSASSPAERDTPIPGGVSLQMRVNGPLVLTVTDSSFVQQDVRCCGCNGGAVSVITGVGATGNQIQVTFSRVQFDGNLNIMPDVEPGTPDAVSGLNSGSCLAIGDIDLGFTSPYEALFAAADVTITGCRFQNSESAFGGCLSLGILNSLLLTESTFDGCTGSRGGSVYMGWNSVHVPLGFLPHGPALTNLMITHSRAWGLNSGMGGGICLDSIGIPVGVYNATFSETQAVGNPDGTVVGGTGGAVQITSSIHVDILSSRFTRVSADFGGAIAADKTTLLSIVKTTFNRGYAGSRGGAIRATNCVLSVEFCEFVDVGLVYQTVGLDQSTVIDRIGGAVAVSGGTAHIHHCSFTRVSALPNDLQLSSCANFYDASSGFSSVGLGGAISAEYCEIDVRAVDAHDLRACSGGLFFARFSQATVADGRSLSDVRAHSGGLAVLVSCAPAVLSRTDSAQGISAVAAGGAIVFNDCPQITVNTNRFTDVNVTNGDGGLIWIYAQRRPTFAFVQNTLTSVTAPAGAGAMIFVQSATKAFKPLESIDDWMTDNEFSGQPAFSSLYGPLVATGVAAVSADQQRLTVSAGALLSTPSSPLRITALDSYQQSITQDRGLVVQVACPAVEFRGTTLRRINATDGSALFSDLRVIAAPGNYTLIFSIVTAPTVSIAVNLTVTADCPAASFYSSSDRSCINCTSDILVYNATANACLGCAAGLHRVANGTGGPLRDGVSCEVCPLGQRSSVGGPCTECGPNTYQPIPLSECVTCSTMDGLNCVGDGLARVDAGFFAMAIGDRADQRIHTFRCPETFCSAAQLQVVTNSSSLLSALAVNSFSQCAFPRLASPTNLLCGECAAGYRPWGNKCAECDAVDGGLLFGLIVLSLALLGWLIHSSFGSPSAGHSVVVLYFVQTAMLELGSLNNLVSWLNIVLLTPNSVGRCVAPLSPYQQVQAQILMPVVLELELLCIGALHWSAFRLRGGAVAAARELALSPLPAAAPLSSKLRSSVVGFVSLFSVDLYVSASLSLMLFCYTQVGVACMSYLYCVKVGPESVVFSQPSMRCESAEYAETWVLVVVALVGFVVGFPLGIGWYLWFRADRVHGAQTIIADRARAEKARKNGEQPPAVITPAVAPASPSPVAALSESPVSAASPSADPTVDLDSDSDEADVPAAWGAVRRRRDVIASDGTIVQVTNSAAAVAAESMANERFLRRYAPVFAMYRPSAWFWQAFMLCRRTVFVALSIGLVSTPRARFLSFGLAHLLSLLLQLLSSPFRLEFFNRAEHASHLLLITLSMTLMLSLPPFPAGIDLFMFLLVVLPLIAYAAIASRQHVGERRARKAMLEYAQRQGQREELALQAEVTAAADRDHCDVGVEMGELHAHRSSTAVELDPQLQANPAATDSGLLGLSGVAPSDSAQL